MSFILQRLNLDFAGASFYKDIEPLNKHNLDRKVSPSEHSELNVYLRCTIPLKIRILNVVIL